MNYYQHHIGDFIRDTSRLSDSQSMAYLRLLWIYYETEQPIENDADAVAFKIGANASDVQQIFKHFFFLHDDGLWHQARCDKEILAFRDRSEKAKKSADARWANANAMRTHTDRKAKAHVSDANQEPLTNNQEPKVKNIKSAKKFTDADLAMAEQFHQSLVASIPGFKEPNLEAWANDIRLMRERDNRTPESILANWRFARQDTFWKTNVLCPGTLREKFDKLTAKSITQGQTQAPQIRPTAANLNFTSADYGRGINADGSF